MRSYTNKVSLFFVAIIVLGLLILSAYLDEGIRLSKEYFSVTYIWTTEKPTVPDKLMWVLDDPANIGYHLRKRKSVRWAIDIPTNGEVTTFTPVVNKIYRVSYNKDEQKINVMGDFYYTIDPPRTFYNKDGQFDKPNDYLTAVRGGVLSIDLKNPR